MQTGRYSGAAQTQSGDNSLWLMGNPDWATLSLRRGGDVDTAMHIMGKTLRWWREGIKDMWNIVAVGGGIGNPAQPAGSPQANSHYGYHMTMWHTVGALSGQLYDAPARRLVSPEEQCVCGVWSALSHAAGLPTVRSAHAALLNV